MRQTTDFDIIVIGSGPAGATTARIAADRGLRVLLVDKRQELGAPIQCSGAVSAHALTGAEIAIDDEFVSTAIYGFMVYDAHGHVTRLDYRELKPDAYKNNPLGYVVDRRRFDRYLMLQARHAGAEVWLKTEAIGYTSRGDGTVAVRVKRFGVEQIVRVRVVVGADGIQSQVGKWAGLHTRMKLSEVASCLQYVMDGVETNGLLEIITGHQWVPGGYAWIFPKGNGYAEVGLGVTRTFTEKDARWHLDNFIRNSPWKKRFAKAQILEVQGGGVPLTAPLKQQYADNIILVGDAARHVNPITGGGIHTALRCGKIAGNFLADFLPNEKPPTKEHLATYQERWMNDIGKKMLQLYRIKRDIFRKPVEERDRMLYQTMSDYFHPDSTYRKI